jgi:general secretion pathway protein E
VEAYARKQSGSIRDDGLRKVLWGKTTLEEVLRVTNEAAE